jgi:hypothetical protein
MPRGGGSAAALPPPRADLLTSCTGARGHVGSVGLCRFLVADDERHWQERCCRLLPRCRLSRLLKNSKCRSAVASKDGSDGTRTRDLRRDSPEVTSAAPDQTGSETNAANFLPKFVPTSAHLTESKRIEAKP